MKQHHLHAARKDRYVPIEVSALVIEDDDDARELLADLIARAGYSVRTARDGHEAVELLRIIRPHVIFVDLEMPIMSGAEFRRLQCRNREWRKIPTVIITGTNSEPLDLAIEATLLKPVPTKDLLDIVRRHEA
jgi:CheY-like chemotaxis protein